MELEHDTRIKGAWCFSARVTTKPADADEKRLGIDVFEPGSKVYCFPPARPEPSAEMKVIGFRRRSGKMTTETVFVRHLVDWRSEYVLDKDVREALSPPWDEDAESKDVAELVCEWHEHEGAWPSNQLREWNRSRVQKQVGAGPWYKRIMTAIKSLAPDQPQLPPSRRVPRRRDD
ncbi:MAG: hypothetical protein JWN24_504 [Phycisphaerales bacterium]|nr:hypothetical protein [Phycisphaerales bacterium]